MTVQFEHDERDTENNIDINKIKNLASNHNQSLFFFRSVKTGRKSRFKIQSGFSIFSCNLDKHIN